jgi:glutaredoxin
MSENNISFEHIDVDLLSGSEKESILREVMEYNPNRSFPTIVIGNKIIVGFREDDIREALGI